MIQNLRHYEGPVQSSIPLIAPFHQSPYTRLISNIIFQYFNSKIDISHQLNHVMNS